MTNKYRIRNQSNIGIGVCVCVFVIYSSSTYSRRSFRRTIIVSCFTLPFFCSQSSNDALVTRMSVESFSTQYALTNGHCAAFFTLILKFQYATKSYLYSD